VQLGDALLIVSLCVVETGARCKAFDSLNTAAVLPTSAFLWFDDVGVSSSSFTSCGHPLAAPLSCMSDEGRADVAVTVVFPAALTLFPSLLYLANSESHHSCMRRRILYFLEESLNIHTSL